ncbi:unnamed protein product [Amoebophrya sp. A120]|nr:unnamed protein product [Amoebophrya sp. A120]|eukprot:GSA120T00012858001.1
MLRSPASSQVLRTNAVGGGGDPQFDGMGNMKTHRVCFTHNNCSDALGEQRAANKENRNPANFEGFAKYHRVKFTANGGVDNQFVQRNGIPSPTIAEASQPNLRQVIRGSDSNRFDTFRKEQQQQTVAARGTESRTTAADTKMSKNSSSRPAKFRDQANKPKDTTANVAGTMSSKNIKPVFSAETRSPHSHLKRDDTTPFARSPSQESIATTVASSVTTVSNSSPELSNNKLAMPAGRALHKHQPMMLRRGKVFGPVGTNFSATVNTSSSVNNIVAHPVKMLSSPVKQTSTEKNNTRLIPGRKTDPCEITAKPTCFIPSVARTNSTAALPVDQTGTSKLANFADERPAAGGKSSIRCIPLEMPMTRRECYA